LLDAGRCWILDAGLWINQKKRKIHYYIQHLSEEEALRAGGQKPASSIGLTLAKTFETKTLAQT